MSIKTTFTPSAQILLGVSLITASALLVRWAADWWWWLLTDAWWTALTNPQYRHEDWIRVDLIGNGVSFVQVGVEEFPASMAVGAVLFVAGIGLVLTSFR